MAARAFLPGLLGLSCSFGEAVPKWPAVIYVAIRKDGAGGHGNAEDPFDGNSAERIAEIMKSAPDGARIYFSTGEYSVGTGIALSNGKSLSIVGSGRTKTVLKLQEHLPSGESRAKPSGGIVLSFWGADQGYTQDSSLYVSDLTLDANVQGSPHSTNFTADAIHTNYPTVVVERVKIVNCGGSENYPTESFHVAIWYPYADSPETRSWHWYQRVSDLQVIVRPGQTHTATVVSVGTATGQPPAQPAGAFSMIENSFFDVAAEQADTYATSIASQSGSFFKNNVMVMRGKAVAMNSDTWDHTGTTIEQNKFFLYDQSSGVRLGSGPDEGTFYDDVVRDNQFFAASATIGFAIQLNGVTRASVTGNQFLSSGGATGRLTAVDINNEYVPHKNESVMIRDNLLETKLFAFPVANLRGEPREGVVTICENNLGADGAKEMARPMEYSQKQKPAAATRSK